VPSQAPADPLTASAAVQMGQTHNRRGSTVGSTSHEDVVTAANDVHRLKKERDDLLQSGVYTVAHPFIQSLTEEIVRKTTQTREQYSN
jgi:hypothetical protein